MQKIRCEHVWNCTGIDWENLRIKDWLSYVSRDDLLGDGWRVD